MFMDAYCNMNNVTQVKWMRKIGMSHEQQRSEVSQALEHQQKSAHTLASLRRLQAQLPMQVPGLTDMIEDLERGSQGLDKFFSQFLDPIFYNEKQPLDICPSGSTSAAQKVFDLPELLEEVLGYLSLVDILHVHQVNQSARASIDGSPRLQSKLSLRAANTDSHLQFPFAPANVVARMMAYFTCHRQMRRAADSPAKGQVRIKAAFKPRNRRLGKIDLRCRQMFVTQPPVTFMHIDPGCCNVGDHGKSIVRSAQGITIGDLWDASQKSQAEHKLCPHAQPHMHDEDGLVVSNPTFTTDVKLQQQDPLIAPTSSKARRPFHKAPKPLSERAQAQEDRIAAYIIYKKKTAIHEEEIVTLEELEAADGLDEYLRIVRAGQPSQLYGSTAPPLSANTIQQMQHFANANPAPTWSVLSYAAHQQGNAQAPPIPIVPAMQNPQPLPPLSTPTVWLDGDSDVSGFLDDEYD
ncbi:hypothetical protein LTR17_001819 [Elasticomyces elasticus]|nr:hypothetical protein LTR17_001819 [Elasticomyces elasticus]